MEFNSGFKGLTWTTKITPSWQLTVIQPVEKLPASYGNWKWIIISTKFRHCPSILKKSVQHTFSRPNYLRNVQRSKLKYPYWFLPVMFSGLYWYLNLRFRPILTTVSLPFPFLFYIHSPRSPYLILTLKNRASCI